MTLRYIGGRIEVWIERHQTWSGELGAWRTKSRARRFAYLDPWSSESHKFIIIIIL